MNLKEPKNRKRIVLVDSFGLIFRAFYAFIRNPLKTKTGQPTSAIFGFLRMVLKIIKDCEPDYIIFAFESKEKTLRHEMFPQYKANRDEPPDELRMQIPKIIELVESFGFPSISMSGYEADDVIASLCEKFRKVENTDVLIVSGDKDLFQLIGDNIYGIVPQKGISDISVFKKDDVYKKLGVNPDQVVDYLALRGDSSDNVPGVKGIGEKTASALLQQFKSLDEIYENLDKIEKKSVRKKLEENREQADLSKKLVQLYDNLDIATDFKKLGEINFHNDKVVEMLSKLELNSILDDPAFSKKGAAVKVLSPSVKEEKEKSKEDLTINVDKSDYICAKTKADIADILNKLEKENKLSIDLETTSENPHIAKIIGFSASFQEGKGFYIPVEHPSIKDYNSEQALTMLKQFIENKKGFIIGQNYKYDYMVFINNGMKPPLPDFDTMIASYILNPIRQSHSMDALAKELLGYTTIKYSDIVKKGSNLLSVDLDLVSKYACEDADITFRLYSLLEKELRDNELEKVFYEIEMPLVKVLAQMELNGVYIDKDEFKVMSQDMEKKMDKLQTEIWQATGSMAFNLNSPKQLQEVLFDQLGLPPQKKTKTGYSTDESVLEKLADMHPVPKMLLEYRTLQKMKSTYLDSLPKLINSRTGRIHTSFNQTITATGRLSSTNPNMQNIPIKGEYGTGIRKGFIGENDNLILSADYSQIELRIMAHLSEDQKLIDAYNSDVDIHVQTASELYSKPIDKVTKEERNNAKTLNYSVIYGAGSNKIAAVFGVSTKEAKNFIENYFQIYRGLTEYIQKQKEKAHKEGKVYTLFHRMRSLPELQDNNKGIVAYGERLAVNTPIQGTSADIIKIAMINIHKILMEKKYKSRMILSVHDELVFEVAPDELDEVKSLVIREMENVVQLKVPLTVSAGYGKSWADAH